MHLLCHIRCAHRRAKFCAFLPLVLSPIPRNGSADVSNLAISVMDRYSRSVTVLLDRLAVTGAAPLATSSPRPRATSRPDSRSPLAVDTASAYGTTTGLSGTDAAALDSIAWPFSAGVPFSAFSTGPVRCLNAPMRRSHRYGQRHHIMFKPWGARSQVEHQVGICDNYI